MRLSSASQHLSHPSNVTADEIIRTLNHMALPTFVDLILVRAPPFPSSLLPHGGLVTRARAAQVGFDGNGNGGVQIDAALLQRHLDVLRKDHHWFHSIERPSENELAVDNHTLPLRVDYVFRASHASGFARRRRRDPARHPAGRAP